MNGLRHVLYRQLILAAGHQDDGVKRRRIDALLDLRPARARDQSAAWENMKIWKAGSV